VQWEKNNMIIFHIVTFVLRDKLCTIFEQCSGRKNTLDRYADHTLQRAGIDWKAFLC
jgi:hypothetical protein